MTAAAFDHIARQQSRRSFLASGPQDTVTASPPRRYMPKYDLTEKRDRRKISPINASMLSGEPRDARW